jgi:hypothetical protein
MVDGSRTIRVPQGKRPPHFAFKALSQAFGGSRLQVVVDLHASIPL